MSMRTYVTRTSTALATATAALGVLTPTSHAGSQAKASSEPAAHERPALAVVSGPAAVPVTLAAVGESTAGSLALVPAASQGSVHVVAGGGGGGGGGGPPPHGEIVLGDTVTSPSR